LLDPGTTARGLFRREEVERMIDEHGSGARDHAYRLWALMMLELWYRRYGPGAS
jgi:asparagine synthase (glutamine-hydrolysing)